MNDIDNIFCERCNKRFYFQPTHPFDHQPSHCASCRKLILEESKDKFITIAHKIESDSVNLKLQECVDKGYKPINMCCNGHTVIILLKKEGVIC